MKTNIYYFSGTGNSLKVAKDISEKLGETTLISIPKAIKSGPDTSVDNIGIVFPVYCWGMPLMVTEFVKKLRKEHAKYFFAIATCGGSAAGTLLQTQKKLARQNIKLSSGFVVQMPTNYIVWGGAISEERQKKMFENWVNRTGHIANTIKKQEEHGIESGSILANFFLSKALYSVSMPHFLKMDKDFWVDSRCDHCGICKKVCPADNIEIKEGKPVWNHKCEQCLACIQWCPKQAIQYGKKTQERERYTNPFVNIKEFIK
ncbi:MAG: EFR1 family ferrodoxin [Thermotaleaceae bacterium]